MFVRVELGPLTFTLSSGDHRGDTQPAGDTDGGGGVDNYPTPLEVFTPDFVGFRLDQGRDDW